MNGWIGSQEHKELFCRTFLETHDPYKPEELPWPRLKGAALRRLQNLPIWTEAVNTERETALKVKSFGDFETDPELREAIVLQGYEEFRHARILTLLVEKYGISVKMREEPQPPSEPEWEFLRVGYGECFDSFFAFGLFALAERSGFFPPELIRMFEPVMQEEARHIQFFANWIGYRRFRTPPWARPKDTFERGLALSWQILLRVRMAMEMGGADEEEANFVTDTAQSFGGISPRGFIEMCLAENERRLARYDERLLKPKFAPAMARMALRVLPRESGAFLKAPGLGRSETSLDPGR